MTDLFSGVMGLAICLVIGFLPTIIALMRRDLSVGAIFVLNLLLIWMPLGWVIAVWIVALIWSCTGKPRSGQIWLDLLVRAAGPVRVRTVGGRASVRGSG